ncbi:hypothetical protein [Halorientalis regularis]|jgi:hypothetical protein|uniref:Uncharacterized protein n=1 Tax=Halorientalis regularis TaxID=660518 RepID=A0A1G7Q1G9_9EURY|nr:hypothetical protein [Halorientalis regularis]SDF91470.1 hypothetical protein SAMN05216218_11184 [Halorientalis regularis]
MVGSRTVTAALGVAVSLLVSVALWWYFESFVFFLFLPFVPFLFRGDGADDEGERVRECPQCGFRTDADEYEFCPRDGTRLD